MKTWDAQVVKQFDPCEAVSNISSIPMENHQRAGAFAGDKPAVQFYPIFRNEVHIRISESDIAGIFSELPGRIIDKKALKPVQGHGN